MKGRRLKERKHDCARGGRKGRAKGGQEEVIPGPTSRPGAANSTGHHIRPGQKRPAKNRSFGSAARPGVRTVERGLMFDPSDSELLHLVFTKTH